MLGHRTIKRVLFFGPVPHLVGYDESLYLKRLFMPRVAAGLSRWPFKPKYRVQLSDGVLGDGGPLDAFQQGRDYSCPICLVRLMVRPLASQARNMGSIPVLGTQCAERMDSH